MNEIVDNYNQLLEELLKLFPDEKSSITNILIMEDNLKLQSIEIFCDLLNDDDLYSSFLKRKIKSFSSKCDNTRDLSNSLFGTTLTLKNIFNNQTVSIKNTLWAYLHLIYLTRLLENKDDNFKRILQLEVELKKTYQVKESCANEESDTNPLKLNVNKDTNNMINDIINSFENKLSNKKGNPLENIMEITDMINGKYNDKINNGDIEIEKLLENITGSLPGLDKMMGDIIKPQKKKETVIIDENFSTDVVTVEKENTTGGNLEDVSKMMGMFNKITNLTDSDGNIDVSSFINQVSKDNNMTDDMVNNMKNMMDNFDV